MGRNDLGVAVIEENDLVSHHAGFSGFAERGVVPAEVLDVDASVVHAPHGAHVLLVGGECDGGHLDLVLLLHLEQTALEEVPEEDLSFEAHLTLLASGDEAATLGNAKSRDGFV